MGRWSRARACGWLSTAMSIRVSTDHKSFCQLATSMTLNQRAVFLGFSPIVTVQASDACARDTKWSRAAQAGLLGFAGERHGVYFLDLEWPLASMPNSSPRGTGTCPALCGIQPVNYCETVMNLRAIEQTASWGQHRVNGVEPPRHQADGVMGTTSRQWRGTPEFDFHICRPGGPDLANAILMRFIGCVSQQN